MFLGFKGLGFGVWGVGFRVSGLGFRFRVEFRKLGLSRFGLGGSGAP